MHDERLAEFQRKRLRTLAAALQKLVPEANAGRVLVGKLLGCLVQLRLELELAQRRYCGGRQFVAARPEQVGQP